MPIRSRRMIHLGQVFLCTGWWKSRVSNSTEGENFLVRVFSNLQLTFISLCSDFRQIPLDIRHDFDQTWVWILEFAQTFTCWRKFVARGEGAQKCPRNVALTNPWYIYQLRKPIASLFLLISAAFIFRLNC